MRNSRSFGKNRPLASPGNASFTLVEMLVAVAVSSILMLLLTQFIVTASRNAMSQNAKMESLGDARGALDRFALDWSARVRRSDVTITATTNTINFLSQVRNYNGTRQLSSVAYQVGTNYTLQRGIVGYNWLSTDPTPDNNPMMTYPTSTSPSTVAPVSPATGDYETLSSDVFRLSIGFLGTTGYSTSTSLANSTNLYGIVVTMAALDAQNRKLLSTTQIASLAGAMDSGITNGASPLSVWQNSVNSTTFATSANVPKQVASAVRVYQRVFYTKE